MPEALLNREQCVEEARSIGEEIHRHALCVKDGSVTWRDAAVVSSQETKLVRMGPHFYSGVTGTAFFLAALERFSGGQSFSAGDLALRALAPVRQKLRRLVDDPARAERLNLLLGGVIGLGAYVYCFVRIGRWLDEPALISEACQIATLITSPRIAGDVALDVAEGSAGATLALLALAQATAGAGFPKSRALERAQSCGDHLLRQRSSTNGQPRAWSARGFPPWCGFSHGAAGIVYALMRLYERTGRQDFLTAAFEGLDFERLHYDPEHRNWRDLRFPEPSFMTTWCHGAPGIALGRLGILPITDDPEIAREIRRGLETTWTNAESPVDFICCGNMGRADILLYAYGKLDEPEFLTHALELASRTVSRAQRSGGYRWFEEVDNRFNPAFFTGAAGAGYTLLRFAEPTKVPCVLLLE